jgi:hypothetical protein
MNVNAKWRNLSSYMMVYQNVRLLAFALLSSLVDIGTAAYRARSLGTWAAYKNAIKAFNNEEAKEAANMLGIIRHGVADSVLNDQPLNTYINTKAKKMNDWFFRANGMEAWTNFTRTASMLTAIEFMQVHASRALEGNEESHHYLRELDITPWEIKDWDGNIGSSERVDYAIHRFVDSSVVRPNAAIRPTWGSDPRYAVLWHLKSFMFGFHEVFLRRVMHETNMAEGAAKVIPFMMLGMFALPLAAFGYELRKLITGRDLGAGDMDFWEYNYEIAQRSGIFGTLQFVADMEAAGDFGKPFLLGAAGPSAEQAWDVVANSAEEWGPKSVPLASSVPWMRNGIRDIIDND